MVLPAPLRTTLIGFKVRAALVRRRVTGLAGAILPPIDHRDLDEIAETEAIINPHDRSFGPRQDRPHRHVLVKRPIGRRAANEELPWIVEKFSPLVGIVVLHLM